MLRTYIAQQRLLLHMARKITLPQTDCRQGSPRCPFSSGCAVSSGSSVLSGSSVSPCAPLACNSRSSFSLDTSVMTAAAKASRRAALSRWQLCLVMFSIYMKYRQLFLIGQLSLEGSCESASQGIITSGSVLSKTAIFPKNEGRKREISNESARGSSLRKANV